MENHNIKPERITKPIQLLAVWLIGLILIVSALLTAAGTIHEPYWLPAFFSISAVCIIPLFLALIFLLQTRFRPQMQEDEYYSKFLNTNTLEVIETPNNEFLIDSMTNKIDEKFIELSTITKDQIIFLQESITEIGSKLPNNFTIQAKKEINTFDNFIKNTKTTIFVNLKLDQIDAVLSTLTELTIKVDSFFGKDEKSEKPKLFAITFGVNVDFETLKTVILKFVPIGLTHVAISGSKNNLYIGAYSYRSRPTALLNEELIEIVKKSSSTLEFFNQVSLKMK